MRELTRGGAKEMLPVAGVPLAVHALQEAAASGIQEALLVLSPTKLNLLSILRAEAPPALKVTADLQPEPLGLAEAEGRCREFLGEKPFALLLPDTLFAGPEPALAQVLKAFQKRQRDCIGFTWVTKEDVLQNSGAVELEEGEAVRRILRLGNKDPGNFKVLTAQRRPRLFPRAVHFPHYLDLIQQMKPKKGDLDDVPLIQKLIQEREVLAVELQGRGFDTGSPLGLRAARDYFEGEQKSDSIY